MSKNDLGELFLNSWERPGGRVTQRLYDTTVGCFNEGDELKNLATDAFFLEPFDEEEPLKGYFI